MSSAEWCARGNHSFDGSRTDTIIIVKKEYVVLQHGGSREQHTPFKNICGDCAKDLGLDKIGE